MSDLAYLPAEELVVERRPAVGYAMVAGAALLFAVNGTVSKVVLASGMSSLRLTEVRSLGAFLGFAAILAVTRPAALRVDRRELLFLALFGLAGVASVQLFYFLSIHRLQIGVALLIQYTAPLLVALWVFLVLREHVRRRLWVALGLALVGLSLVVDLWGGVSLDGLGVAFGALSAVAYAAYILFAEHAIGRRDTVSLLCYGFLFASLLWAVVQPWWSFPISVPQRDVSLLGHLSDVHLPVWALLAWIVVLGTVVPFLLIVAALHHIRATRVAIVAMLEPVVASIVAWAWLGERLGTEQLVGGAIVLAGIGIAQTAR
jgi:drug/metabolite transporter (DMT)-like permease